MRAAALALAAVLALTATGAQADHRQSCDVMRGTAYQHAGEREWYWNFCVDVRFGGGANVLIPAATYPVQNQAVAVGWGYSYARAVICAPQYAWDCGSALSIVYCESKYDPWATGAAGEAGLFQVHPIHGLGASGYDPYTNVSFAHSLYLQRGWQPWSCKPW